MTYTPTLEDFEEIEREIAAEEAQDGQSQGFQPTEKDWREALQAAELNDRAQPNAVRRFGRGLAAGALEGAANVAPSIANAVISPIAKLFGKEYGLPYADLSSFSGETPAGKAGHMTGNVAGLIGPGGIAFKALSKMLGKPSLVKQAAAASGTGALLGGSENELLSRGIGAALGAIPLGHGVISKTVADKAVGRKQELGKYFGKEYEDILNTADKLIPQGVRIPSPIQSEEALKKLKPLGSDAVNTLRAFLNKPSLRTAHEAQSDLGKIVRDFENKNIGKNLLSSEIKAVREAANLRKRIKGTMQDAFVKNKLEPLGKRYQELNYEYAGKMPQYLIKEIGKYEHNPAGTSPRAVTKAMHKEQGKAGNKQHYKEIPGYTVNKHIGKVMHPIDVLKKLLS